MWNISAWNIWEAFEVGILDITVLVLINTVKEVILCYAQK